MRDRSPGSVILDVLINIIMALVLLTCLLPFVYMFSLSLSDPKEIINNRVFLWPVGITFDAYKQIFTYPNFFRAYGNTIFYTVGGTAIALTMTSIVCLPAFQNIPAGAEASDENGHCIHVLFRRADPQFFACFQP